MKDFDDLMANVGSHGPYQRRILAGVICPTSILAAMTMNTLLFQVPVPDHWCHVPGQENTSYSHEAWINLTIPRDIQSGKLSTCSQYRVEWTGQWNESLIVHNDTHACESGWEHDTSEFQDTMATTNQWFCEEKGYSDHVYSLNVAGNTVGSIVLPVLADRFIGRRLMFYISLFIYVIFTLPAVWVSNYGFHLTLRFLAGLAFETNYMMPYIIGLEFLAPDKRTAATLVSFAAWTLGMCLTSLISWLLPRWQYLALVSCVPSVLAFAYWWSLPESPRWLLSQGRIHECATILLNVARINGKKDVSRAQVESDLYILWNLQEKEVSLKEATRYPKLRLRALILFFMGACSYLCYGVVFLGITVLSSNYFVSHFVLSISELPSNALGWTCTQFLGRRFTCITTFLITAAIVAAAPFCRHDKWVMLAIVAFIRLSCTQLIYVVYVQCTEIFPTPLRSTGLAWLIVCGLATMISTPYLLHSGIGEDFPYWFLLALMLLCALLGTFLPETMGLPLPQTFQDSEDLGNGRPLRVWVNHWNQHRYVPVSSQEERYQELRKLSLTNPEELRRMSSRDERKKMSR